MGGEGDRGLLWVESLVGRGEPMPSPAAPRPSASAPSARLTDADRRFWILASRWFCGWRETLLIVRPDTVLGWHRKGWRAYWRWRSRAPAIAGGARSRRGQIATGAWPRRISCGVNGGSKRSWRGWASRSRPEPLPSTCACRATENHRPAGEPFLNGTLLRSGPVTSSASRLYGSGPSMPSSWSATPGVKCCMSR